MITIIAGFTVRRQDKAKLVEAARKLIALSRKEPGNVSYALYEQTDDPYRMSFIEGWQDQAAVDRHVASEHFNRICAQMSNYMEAGMTITQYRENEAGL